MPTVLRLSFSGSFGSGLIARLNDLALLLVRFSGVIDVATCSVLLDGIEGLVDGLVGGLPPLMFESYERASLLLGRACVSLTTMLRTCRGPSGTLALWSLPPSLQLLDRAFVALLGDSLEDLPSELLPLRTSLLEERVRSLLLDRAAGGSVVLDVLGVSGSLVRWAFEAQFFSMELLAEESIWVSYLGRRW